jgi:hypothetical protein
LSQQSWKGPGTALRSYLGRVLKEAAGEKRLGETVRFLSHTKWIPVKTGKGELGM